jgi:hypothetical protein
MTKTDGNERPIAENLTIVQFDPMSLSRVFPLLLIVACVGCSDADGEATSNVVVGNDLATPSANPGYDNPQEIAALFRFRFEESSIALCSSSVTPETPACLHDSQRCWLEFDDNANSDMDAITKQHFIAEEGTYWIEGVGRMATQQNGFGHLNTYDCQVEMTNVSRFEKIDS